MTLDRRHLREEAGSGSFDVFILDAFSSDSIPVHLLRRGRHSNLYLRHLEADGVIAGA
ncbi:MAG: hypothetical protein U5R48_18855 [Gammaproteobacteria bacterium]|nr:hypothetical protein [Gammaproteobacteria bacterium]